MKKLFGIALLSVLLLGVGIITVEKTYSNQSAVISKDTTTTNAKYDPGTGGV